VGSSSAGLLGPVHGPYLPPFGWRAMDVQVFSHNLFVLVPLSPTGPISSLSTTVKKNSGQSTATVSRRRQAVFFSRVYSWKLNSGRENTHTPRIGDLAFIDAVLFRRATTATNSYKRNSRVLSPGDYCPKSGFNLIHLLIMYHSTCMYECMDYSTNISPVSAFGTLLTRKPRA
jgi:hypothetical protein